MLSLSLKMNTALSENLFSTALRKKNHGCFSKDITYSRKAKGREGDGMAIKELVRLLLTFNSHYETMMQFQKFFV